jgi:kojibiose phosphorylase
MRNDISLDGWHIRSVQDAFADDFRESIFFTGNGRMGVRGYSAAEPQARPVQKGLFVAGMFAEIKPGITDFVNLPTPVWYRITLNGRPAQLCGKIEKDLDLSCGLLTQRYTVAAGDLRMEVREEHFFSPEYPSCLVQRLVLQAQRPCDAKVLCGISAEPCNCPVPDDQVKENHETVCLMQESSHSYSENAVSACFAANGTGLTLAEHYRCAPPAGWQTKPEYAAQEYAGLSVSGSAEAGVAYMLDSVCRILTSRDRDPLLADVPASLDYEELLSQSRAAWRAAWERCGIEIEGDPSAETALRYTVYQLLANGSPRDDTVNIGARGLTHTRYKGCYFWDTDLFMMPFYLYELPQAAKSLEQYRVNALPQAQQNAKRMNAAGARYPWMASFDGSEQCESWDIGASELHITADVVYALDQYVKATGDTAFAEKALPVYIETARFWISRYSPDPLHPGKFNLLFCKGPDEYCGITSNNLYTNVMVRHNLQLAMEAAAHLHQSSPQAYAALHLSPEETARWQALYDGIRIPRDPANGHLRADDTFHLLEPVDIAALKADDSASYHTVCFDRLQRCQVIKQADALLLMTRFPTLFSQKEKLDAWHDFEPLCLHDSTLSFASHAYFAAQNGILDKACSYFNKALFLDLKEIMGNTGKEGLHLANFGETWQTVVFGFAGLCFDTATPALHPHLPEQWKTLRFHFCWRGETYSAKITPHSAAVQKL